MNHPPYSPLKRNLVGLAAAVALSLAGSHAAAGGLDGSIESVVTSGRLQGATCGVFVVDLSDDSVLAAVEPDASLIPASNMKLITSAAALDLLGPDFVFKTRLLHDGRNLILRGDGDPAFGDPNLLAELDMTVENLLQTWVRVVGKAGIKRLERLIIDDRVFDRQWTHESWEPGDLHKWYAAEVAGLNVNDNCLDIYATPTGRGEAPRFRFMPIDPPVRITNLAKSGDRNRFWADRKPGTNDITLYGEVKHRFIEPIHVTVHDPPMLLGHLLRDRLLATGVQVGEVERPEDQRPRPAGQVLAVVQSPLPTVITRCNRSSQNLFAEALIKRIGHAVTGQPGSWSNGAAAVRLFLSRRIGPEAAHVAVSDGSGLSRDNRVTPRTIVAVLTEMYGDQQLGPIYIRSLATPGEGTLARRFRRVNLDGQLFAKTGRIQGVAAMSGYILHDGGGAAFSIIINNYNGPGHQAKDLIDRVVGLIDDHLDIPEPAEYGG